jgi:hypothetical protein
MNFSFRLNVNRMNAYSVPLSQMKMVVLSNIYLASKVSIESSETTNIIIGRSSLSTADFLCSSTIFVSCKLWLLLLNSTFTEYESPCMLSVFLIFAEHIHLTALQPISGEAQPSYSAFRLMKYDFFS